MDFKHRITYLLTILITFTSLLLFMPLIDSAASAAEEESLYVLHVSSFKNQKGAETEISTFREQGLQAFYRNEAVEGKGNWFRVFIGTFKTRQEAIAKGVELMGKGIISYAAPRAVTPDFIPGRKTVEVETIAEEPVKPPVIEETPPQEEPLKTPVVEEKPAEVETPQEPVAKPIEKTVQEPPAPEKIITAEKEIKVEQPPKKKPTSQKHNFSLSLTGGVYISSNAEDFVITEQTPSVIRTFFFTGGAYQISLESGIRAYKDLNFYGRVEYVFADDVNIFFTSLGPKLRFNLSESVFPYIKGGLVWGDFSFDAAPGKFDDNFGYEGGFGLDILKSPYKFGFDLLYRDITFDYIHPGIADVTTNANSIDVSGCSISGTFTYFF